MELKEDKNRIRLVVGWIVDIAVVISIAWFAVFAMGTQIRVSGQSMEPVLSQNEKVLMNRLSYRVMRPKRYDIIVFEKETGNYNIKRVIGLPGETVQVIDGYMYINGKKLDEHYGAEVMEDPGIAAEPIKLGDDEYFVLGDNRNHSSDSRVASVGVLTRDMLIGRAWVRIYPFNKIGVIKHE